MKNNPVIIDLQNISVSFDEQKILNSINLQIHDGEFVTFLGPSGCGKTTTLRIIAGFLNPDEGNVIFEGQNINGVPAYKRQVNTIFQRYALFPHLNVYENIAFGLRLKKMKEKDIQEKVREMLELVNLKGFGSRNVNSLSGGQQQRVAIARALASKAPVLLADEPTGNLDEDTAKDIVEIFKSLAHEQDKCVIVVTHSKELAEEADVILTLKQGTVIATEDTVLDERIREGLMEEAERFSVPDDLKDKIMKKLEKQNN